MSTPMNTVWMLVEVDTNGGISAARVQRAPITIRNEVPLMNFVRSLVFDPATLDGNPHHDRAGALSLKGRDQERAAERPILPQRERSS